MMEDKSLTLKFHLHNLVYRTVQNPPNTARLTLGSVVAIYLRFHSALKINPQKNSLKNIWLV